MVLHFCFVCFFSLYFVLVGNFLLCWAVCVVLLIVLLYYVGFSLELTCGLLFYG